MLAAMLEIDMDRSKAQIRWLGSQLCLVMVNHESTYFNLYAKPFLAMMGSPSQGFKVKSRDKNIKQAVGYYGGDIGGILRINGSLSIITLYFGNITGVYNRLGYDEEARTFMHVRFTEEYCFPKAELEAFSSSISIMHRQCQQFDVLMMAADTAPNFTSR